MPVLSKWLQRWLASLFQAVAPLTAPIPGFSLLSWRGAWGSPTRAVSSQPLLPGPSSPFSQPCTFSQRCFSSVFRVRCPSAGPGQKRGRWVVIAG